MATIYAIECRNTGMAYVGCTKAVKKRMREHLCWLRKRRHSEKLFQQEYDLYGEEAFDILPLEALPETASISLKRERELFWMDRYDSIGLLYNLNRCSFQPTAAAMARGLPAACAAIGNKRSAEANLKRSLAQLGKPKGHGAKISATKQARKAMR